MLLLILVSVLIIVLIFWYYFRSDTPEVSATKIKKISLRFKAWRYRTVPYIVYEFDSGYRETRLLKNWNSVKVYIQKLLKDNPSIELDKYLEELVERGTTSLIKEKLEKKDFEYGVLIVLVMIVVLILFTVGYFFQKIY